MTHKVLEEIRKINARQVSMPAILLCSLRARWEFKKEIPNRIGRVFKNGNKGVMFVGRGGSGKSQTLSRVFNGLGLGGKNAAGKKVGVWIHSADASTALGVYSTLKSYQDSMIFIDEMKITTKNVGILKQICNGKLSRQTAHSEDSFDFTGMIAAASNGFAIPRKQEELEHLLATLDRYWVINVKPIDLSPEEYMEKSFEADEKSEEDHLADIDFGLIKENLFSERFYDLNNAERELVMEIWGDKSLEIIDPTRAQWRNARSAIDIMVFVKRFLDVEDLTKDEEAIEFAKEMIDDAIIFNPASVMFLETFDEIIYRVVKKATAEGRECDFQEIQTELQKCGFVSNSTRKTYRRIETMIESMIIQRTQHGKYSTKRRADNNVESGITDLAL